jgi:hypothetical protein
LDISIVDPRNPIALWDIIRYQVRPSRPAWVLNRKKFSEGIPEFEELRNKIEEALNKEGS